MRIALAVAVVVALASPAQAHPEYHYAGGCGLSVVHDGRGSTQTRWFGEIHGAAIATHAGTGTPTAVPIEIRCELRRGTTTLSIVLVSGTGAVSGAAPITFQGDPDDVLTFCETVTVAGESHAECGDVVTVPVVPEPLSQFIIEVVGGTFRSLTEVGCSDFAAQSGGPFDQPPAFDIRSDGDLFANGTRVWDCPPYGSSGS